MTPTRRCDNWRRKSARRGAAPHLRASSPTSTGCRRIREEPDRSAVSRPFYTASDIDLPDAPLLEEPEDPKQASAAMEFEIELDCVTEDSTAAPAGDDVEPLAYEIALDAIAEPVHSFSAAAEIEPEEPPAEAYAIEIDAASSDTADRWTTTPADTTFAEISSAFERGDHIDRPAVEPEPTHQSTTAFAPEPTYEPEIASAPEPTYEPEAVYQPEPTYEPEPAYQPEPTPEPEATYQPEPASEPGTWYPPESTYEPPAPLQDTTIDNAVDEPVVEEPFSEADVATPLAVEEAASVHERVAVEEPVAPEIVAVAPPPPPAAKGAPSAAPRSKTRSRQASFDCKATSPGPGACATATTRSSVHLRRPSQRHHRHPLRRRS